VRAPEEFRYAGTYGTVLHVYPQAWEVDVLAEYGGIIQRAAVIGARLPEVSADDRPQWVYVFWAHATHGQAFCLPVSSRLPGTRYDRDGLVYVDEIRGYRITVREPGHPTENQVGELEVRSEKGGRVMQLRVLESGGVVRIDTPNTSLVLHDDEGGVTIECTETARINCKNAVIEADEDIDANAGGDVSVRADGDASVRAAGNANVVATNALGLQAGQALTISGATVTITSGGVLTITAAGAVTINAPTVAVP